MTGVLAREAQHRSRPSCLLWCTSCSALRILPARRCPSRRRPSCRTGRPGLSTPGLVPRLRVEGDAGVEVVDEVDGLLAFLGVREGGGAEVVAPGREARDDRFEVGVRELHFQSHVSASAVTRSASIPMIVWPSEARNSFGAYWASVADVERPLGFDRRRNLRGDRRAGPLAVVEAVAVVEPVSSSCCSRTRQAQGLQGRERRVGRPA